MSQGGLMTEVESQSPLEVLRLHKQRGSERTASNVAKALMSNGSHSLPLVLEMVRALMATHDYKLARDLLEKNTGARHSGWATLWLELQWRTDFRDDLIDAERDLTTRFPRSQGIKIRYLQKLISLKKFKLAKQFVGVEGLSNSPKFYFKLRFFLALALGWKAEIDLSVGMIFATGQQLFSVQEQLVFATQYSHRFSDRVFKTFSPEIDGFLVSCQLVENPQLTNVRLKRAAQQGDWPTVQSILQDHPELSETPLFVNASTWLAAHLGDMLRARSIFRRQSHLLSNKALRPCRVGELIKLDDKSLRSCAATRLFSVVRNEATRIPWFLDFYRALGVDRFVFVDNGSTDGTREMLLSQPDAHVFLTMETHANGASGMVWVNELMNKLGRKGWNLYVDVDEALVFPNSERDGLDYLIHYMERHKQEALPAFMLDMHARRGLSHPVLGLPENDFIDAYPFYDADFEISAGFLAPYYEVWGGRRDHLFGDRSPLTKTPLIRGGRGTIFLQSSHIVSPVEVSDVAAALLHFRMTDEFLAEVQDDITNGTRGWQSAIRQAGYLSAELEEPAIQSGRSCTGFFENSDSLLRAGLISAPTRYFEKIP
jgi:hypothetical protein